MILCRYLGNWYLSTGITKDRKQCGLRCSPLMPHPQDFKPLPPVGAVLYGAVSELDEITFYPEIRFRSARVYPECWTRDSSEPLLRCRMMPWDSYSAGYTDEQQKADDWQCVGSPDGATKWIHVDELEKIEGSPPEGAF